MFKASAPGSLMLLGEYAVLYGKQALVCAVDKYITVTLIPRADNQVELTSALGHFKTDLSHLESVAPFQFVLATCKQYQRHFKSGFAITIESEFSHQVGLASSAAVTVATLTVFSAWLKISFSRQGLIKEARKIICKVQGLGSGADIAGCVLGGIVAYRAQPFSAHKLMHSHPLTVIYSGSKTPTVEAVTHVKNFFAAYPDLFKAILHAIDACAHQGIEAVRCQEWAELGKIMTIQQSLMDALGVNTPLLRNIIDYLRTERGVLGAKISGSGLGDCVIGLGSVNRDCASLFSHEGVKNIDVRITLEGVKLLS